MRAAFFKRQRLSEALVFLFFSPPLLLVTMKRAKVFFIIPPRPVVYVYAPFLMREFFARTNEPWLFRVCVPKRFVPIRSPAPVTDRNTCACPLFTARGEGTCPESWRHRV